MKKEKITNRIIGFYQILGGILGFVLTALLLFKAIPALSNQSIFSKVFFYTVVLYSLAAYALSFFAGIFLFKAEKKGWLLSIINQSIQLPGFTIAGFSYYLVSGLEIPAYFALNTSKQHYLFYLGTRWDISYSIQDQSLWIGINIISLILLIYLIIGYRKIKKQS